LAQWKSRIKTSSMKLALDDYTIPIPLSDRE
jgi:hypothetical protein